VASLVAGDLRPVVVLDACEQLLQQGDEVGMAVGSNRRGRSSGQRMVVGFNPVFPFLVRLGRGLGRGSAVRTGRHGPDCGDDEPGLQGERRWRPRFLRPGLAPRVCAAASLRLGLNGAERGRQSTNEQGAISYTPAHDQGVAGPKPVGRARHEKALRTRRPYIPSGAGLPIGMHFPLTFAGVQRLPELPRRNDLERVEAPKLQ
jgi:hypothetical protein